MTDGYRVEKIILLPAGFHLKKSAHVSEIGFIEGMWKTQGFATRYLRLATTGDKSAILGILNHFLLRDAVFAQTGESCLKRHHNNALFIACDFGNDPYVWPIVRMEHTAARAFSLNVLPQLRADLLILQYAHFEAHANGQAALTVIAGTDARFAGDMTHIKKICEEYGRKKMDAIAAAHQKKIGFLHDQISEVAAAIHYPRTGFFGRVTKRSLRATLAYALALLEKIPKKPS